MGKKKDKKHKAVTADTQKVSGVLIQIEEYIQENGVSDFSELSVLLRLEHEEWYMPFVQNFAYFKELIKAQQKKRLRENVLPDEPEETKKSDSPDDDTVAIGKETFVLYTPSGKQRYGAMLNALINVYPFKRNFAEKDNMFFIIENAGTIVAVCTDKGKAFQTAEALCLWSADMFSDAHHEVFYDVCWYGKNGLNFEHYKAEK